MSDDQLKTLKAILSLLMKLSPEARGPVLQALQVLAPQTDGAPSTPPG